MYIKILILLVCILFTGCESSKQNIISDISSLLNKKHVYDNWKIKKTNLIVNSFNNKIPLILNKQLKYVPIDKLSKVIKSLDEQLDYSKKNISEKGEYLRLLKNTSLDYRDSINYFDDILISNANEFRIKIVGSNYKMYQYCNNKRISSNNCTLSSNKYMSLPILLLREELFNKYPKYKQWYDFLITEEKKINKLILDIENNMYKDEYYDYLRKVNKKFRKKINLIDDIELSYNMTNNSFRPNKNTIYDLGGFIVLQSLKNGILLKTNNRYKFRVIYVETSKKYPDNYFFNLKESKVFYKGLKTCKSLINAKKTVYSFKDILIDRSNYSVFK